MFVEGRCEICRTQSRATTTSIRGKRHRVVLCTPVCEATYRRLHAERQATYDDARARRAPEVE